MNLAKSKTRKKNPEKIRREKCQWPPLVKSFLFDGCLIVSPLICLLLSSSTLKQLKVINKPLHYYQPDQYLRYLLDAILWSQLYLLKRKHKIIVNWNWQKKNRNEVISNKYRFSCDLLNLPEGVTMGTAISCGFASNVWPKAQWLRIEPLELWARTLYW